MLDQCIKYRTETTILIRTFKLLAMAGGGAVRKEDHLKRDPVKLYRTEPYFTNCTEINSS